MTALCLCGHPDETHVTDLFGQPFRRPRTRQQLAIPCLLCDCEDYQEPCLGTHAAADLLNAAREAQP